MALESYCSFQNSNALNWIHKFLLGTEIWNRFNWTCKNVNIICYIKITANFLFRCLISKKLTSNKKPAIFKQRHFWKSRRFWHNIWYFWRSKTRFGVFECFDIFGLCLTSRFLEISNFRPPKMFKKWLSSCSQKFKFLEK